MLLLGHLGGILGAFWSQVGAAWSQNGASWSQNGIKMGHLGAKIGHLGGILGGSFRHAAFLRLFLSTFNARIVFLKGSPCHDNLLVCADLFTAAFQKKRLHVILQYFFICEYSAQPSISYKKNLRVICHNFNQITYIIYILCSMHVQVECQLLSCSVFVR